MRLVLDCKNVFNTTRPFECIFNSFRKLYVYCEQTINNLTLYRAPRILTGTHHLVAYANKIGATDNGERYVGVHGGVYVRHTLVVSWELVNMYSVRL